jgi:ABC-type nitrate/sulfonate/bicarbonate transport system, permease component
MPEGRKELAYVSLIQAASVIAFLVIWQEIVNRGVVPSLFVASPTQVALHFGPTLLEPFVFERVLYTLSVFAAAFAFTVFAGTVIGLLLGTFIYLRSALEPYMIVLYSIPKAIFIPVFWTFFGLGFSYQFWLASFAGVIPMTLNVMYAVKDVDPELITLSRSLGASPLQVYYKVIIPSIIPAMLSGARISIRAVFADVIAAQEFVGTTGIGYLAQYYATNFEPVPLYVVVVLTALLGMVVYEAIIQAEKRLTRWNVQLS